jgi:hypothetical protein
MGPLSCASPGVLLPSGECSPGTRPAGFFFHLDLTLCALFSAACQSVQAPFYP